MASLRSISLSGEHWKQAKGLSYNYFASNMGRIATIPFFGKNIAKMMSPAKDKYGYYRTVMDGKTVKVHRIIAETWLENPLNLPLVNHIDCNPSNNKIENLEWCSVKYNAYYGVHNGNIKVPTTSISHKKALDPQEQAEIRKYYLDNMQNMTNQEKTLEYEKLCKKYKKASKQQIARYATGQLKLRAQPLTIPSVCEQHHTHIVSEKDILI